MPKKPHAEHHAAAAPKPPHGAEAAAPEPGSQAAPAAAPAPGTVGAGTGAAGAPAPAVAAPESGLAAEAATAAEPPGTSGGEELARLERESADLKDRLLRTAADFDNFRKRAAKEKAEAWERAQADVILKVLEGLDDLGRVAHLDPAQTSAESLHEGAGLVERKLLKELEGIGLERMDPAGQVFDPNAHEAVMTTPAPAAERDGHVAMVFQAGYRLRGFLLRPARVAVFAYTEPPPGEEAH